MRAFSRSGGPTAQNWGDALDDVAAVGSKALRRSFEDATQRSPLHIVQAFGARARLTLTQLGVEGRRNEIPALPKLRDLRRCRSG